jgi:hypothetical protein
MKRLLREPLLHFIVLGAGLFALYRSVGDAEVVEPARIVVTPEQIQHWAATFEQAWQRPPTDKELEDVVNDQVETEVLSREAMSLGLHENDPMIDMRLRQKMEFLAEDSADIKAPTEAELSVYLDEHREAYRERPRFSFRQVCIETEGRDDAEGETRSLLAKLKKEGPDADIHGLGDRVDLPNEFVDQSWDDVSNQLGEPFAERLDGAQIGQWVGPLPSGFGLHVVFISEHQQGAVPPLEEVRDLVANDLTNERRFQAFRKFIDDLMAKYSVTIEWPERGETAMVASGASQP